MKARAGEEQSVGALAQLADAVLLADLPDALEAVLRALADRAALDRDTADLMTAVPPLAAILRYGDVRGSDTSSVAQVLRGIVLRVAIGLPGAGVGADEETGRQLAEAVDGVNSALALLQDADLTRAWREALQRVAAGERLPGTLAGRATRLLHDAGELDPAAPMSRALSPGEDPERGASWIEGFIGTSGLVLVHDPELLAVLDGWVASRARRTPSPTSCRCCAAPSRSSPRASAAASANAFANIKGPVPLSFRLNRRASGREPALETVARLLGG